MMTNAANWKNVNNWHWIEKDCTTWAHDHLKTLLLSVSICVGDKSIIRVGQVTSITGEVSINVRKGRIRQIFDLTIELSCNYDNMEDTLAATIIDYMSDTDYSSLEIHSPQIPLNIREPFKKAIWERLVEFQKDLENIHGKSLLVQAPLTESQSESQISSGPKSKFNGVTSDKHSSDTSSTRSFEESLEFAAPMSEVWACLTEPTRMMVWSRGTARINTFEPGASFTLLNGNIIGTVTALSKGHVRMEWRLKHWESHHVSQVEINLTDCKGQTLLTLKQKGIPAVELDMVKENWHRYYWEPIKTILGCRSPMTL